MATQPRQTPINNASDDADNASDDADNAPDDADIPLLADFNTTNRISELPYNIPNIPNVPNIPIITHLISLFEIRRLIVTERLSSQDFRTIRPNRTTFEELVNNNISQQTEVSYNNFLLSERWNVVWIILIGIPCILATIIVLSIHWNDEYVCSAFITNFWILLPIINSIRILLYISLALYILINRQWMVENSIAFNNAKSFLYQTHRLGVLVLFMDVFLLYTMWLFDISSDENCIHLEQSTTYLLWYTLFIIRISMVLLIVCLQFIHMSILSICQDDPPVNHQGIPLTRTYDCLYIMF